jgi:deazaflavin-dependent oxidoreductase (nitroreductase family)
MLSEELKTRIEHLVDTHSVRFGAWLYWRTNGHLLHLWHRRALILTATGRRSGLPRAVIVQFFPDGQDMIVVADNSGLPTHPAWYFNLKAHPEARVEVEGRTLEVRAEELSPEEAAAFWPRVLDTAPDYARYPRRTTRGIPLLRLIPVGGGGQAT